VQSSVAVADGVLYFSSDGVLYALNALHTERDWDEHDHDRD
jgi:hypothetical protein